VNEQMQKLSGLFTEEQIQFLSEVFAKQEQVDEISEEVESFSTDVDELSDLKRTIEDIEEKVEELPDFDAFERRIDDLEENDPQEIKDEIERDFERSISDITERLDELEAAMEAESPQPTTFKEVWQVFLLVIRNKIKSLKVSKA